MKKVLKKIKDLSKKQKIIIGVAGIIIIFAIVLVIFLLSSNKDNNKVNQPTKEKEEVKEEIPEKKLTIVNEDSNSRPYAVMINNHAQARINHAGLQDAYIVYEMIVEGGLTRMMALFKDKTTDRIGSVRSSRHYYLDYALENDAIYVHFGWSPQAESDIKTLGINNINGLYDSAFWRDYNLGVSLEHTAFTSISNIEKVANSKGYRKETNKELLLNYSIDEVNIDTIEGAITANNVIIPYSGYVKTSYTYNPDLKVYNRFVNGVAHTDAITKNQYTAKNIIIQKVYNYSIDSYGRQTLNNIGTGDGYYITNGYAIPIKWTKNSRSSQTVYTYLNGEEIKVNDGNTYIQIEPTNQSPTIN